MFDFMVWLQNFRTPFLNKFVEAITISAEEMILIAVICIVLWTINKEAGYKLGLSVILASTTNTIFKLIFKISRPWLLDDRIIPIRQQTATGYSFPSGHTQSGAAMWYSLFESFKKNWFRTLAVIMMLLIAFSRVYLSVHTPADVVASLALAVLITFFAHWVMDQVIHKGFTFWLVILAFVAIMGLVAVKNASYAKMAGILIALLPGYLIESKYIRFSPKAVWWKQILKIALGLTIALGLKQGLKLVFPDQIFFDFLRYFFVGGGAICLAPWLFVKLKLSEQEK